MNWDDAEAALRSHIETAWAAGANAAIPLVFENEAASRATTFVHIDVEGIWADKTIYGGTGLRSSVEGGIVSYHAFTPQGDGKAASLALIVAMNAILELRTIDSAIKIEGANPPTPIGHNDQSVPTPQPGGNYYRCSGSVPFVVIGTR